MKRLNISAEDICALGKDSGLVEICGYDIHCEDSYESARRDYQLTIFGKDSHLNKKKLFFSITAWEELVQEDGDNKTQE